MDTLIDTHCHLHDQEWFSPEQQREFLVGAEEDGVKQIICIGTGHEDALQARDFAERHENVFWTYGIHPEYASKYAELGPEVIKERFFTLLDESKKEQNTGDLVVDNRGEKYPFGKLVAIGEVGLDYHYTPETRNEQIRLLEQMLELADQTNLPVSFHVREAFADFWPVLDNFPKITGVLHSFTGSKKELKRALERELYVGVNGLCTYTTTALPPLENMLLETDAPFLTPEPNRGKMNEPRYVRTIATYLAENLGVAEEIIAEQTTKNARKLFKIGQEIPKLAAGS